MVYTYKAGNVFVPGFPLPAPGSRIELVPDDSDTPVATYDMDGNPAPLRAGVYGIYLDFRADIPYGRLRVVGSDLPMIGVASREAPSQAAEDAAAAAAAAAGDAAASAAAAGQVLDSVPALTAERVDEALSTPGSPAYQAVSATVPPLVSDALASDDTIVDAAVDAMADAGDPAVASMVTDPGSATYAELHRTLVGKNELAWNVADFGASPSADPDINRVAFQIAVDGACTDAAGDVGSNLLRNGDFELGPVGWTGNNGSFSEDARSGGQAWVKPADVYRQVTSHVMPAPVGAEWLVSAWVKTPDGGTDGAPIPGSGLVVQVFDGESWSNGAVEPLTYGSDWRHVEYTYTPPAGTRQVRIQVYSNAQTESSILVDDVHAGLAHVSNPHNCKTVSVPDGGTTVGAPYRLAGQVNVPSVCAIVGGGGRPWVSFTQGVDTGEHGFAFVDEAAVGASPQEWFLVDGLAFKGACAGFIYAQGIATFRVRRCFFHMTDGPTLKLEYCQDFKVEDVDVYYPNARDARNCVSEGRPELSVVYIYNNNNVYFDLFRCERPESTVIYAESFSGVFNRGKIDSNMHGQMDDPVLVFSEADVTLDKFMLHGLKSRPVRCVGPVDLDFRTGVGGDFSGPVVELVDQYVTYNPEGYMRGVRYQSRVTFGGDAYVWAENNNVVWTVDSLVRYVAPDPVIQSAADGVEWQGNVRITERFGNGYANGAGFLRAKLAWWDESSETWQDFPYGPDALNGMYLLDTVTGDRTRIIDQQTGSHFMLEEPFSSGRFPNSPDDARYRVTNDEHDGVEIRVEALEVRYRRRPDWFTFTAAERVVPDVQVVSAVFDAAEALTTVDVGADLSNVAPGHYLVSRDSDEVALLVRGVDGTSVTVDHDMRDVLSGHSWWDIRAGKAVGLSNLNWRPVTLSRPAHGMNQSS